MSDFDLSAPHRRYNPLTGEWVLVSPHRTQRPWLGQEESVAEGRPSYDPGCYLCPGNTRANGESNPSYGSTFVFQNDFAAIRTDDPDFQFSDGLLRAESVRGECRVICFSPRHDLTLAQMSVLEIGDVIRTWIEQTRELSAKYPWVQVFENKGAVMGCSNPHPHGQIWAGSAIPSLPATEDRMQREYAARGSVLLEDYLSQELAAGERVVFQNEFWAAVVPFWAVWPFETMLLPKFSARRMTDLDSGQVEGLAAILKDLLSAYDRLFATDFPYSMGWHGAPFDGSSGDHWLLHAHFYPPLLRSATVKKFMVGYEMMAEPQRDLTPELAANRIRNA